MPDIATAIALLLLVSLVEASPLVRLPAGLLLAIGLLVSGAELLPIALLGAVAVMLARLWLALAARRGRDRAAPASAAARAQREALKARLSHSRAYARMSFTLAAIPGVPAGFVFPLLGAMRAPLWPAMVGTIVGRTPVLALTAAIFVGVARFGSDTDREAALTLGIFAVLLLVFRTVALVDWKHRAETGKFRLRDPDEHAIRMTTMLGGTRSETTGMPPHWARPDHVRDLNHDDDVVEGELIGEEHEPRDDDEPPAALPPTGAAPS